jgi:glutamine synthetase
MKYLNQYVWSDKYGESRVLTRYENDQGLDKLICLNGLNTGQSVDDNNSDIYIKPVQQYNNPFYKRTKELEPSIFVCEVMLDNTTPHSSNERLNSIKTLENYDDVKMSVTNEFFITKKNVPVAFLSNPPPTQQGIFYCGVGGDIAIGQECANEIFQNSYKSDLNVTELFGSVAPSQWGITLEGDAKVKLLDDLICLRYIISRTAEKFGVTVCFHPQLLKQEWNGSGCIISFSNEKMRNDSECNYIRNTVIKNLEKTHNEYISLCGEDNDRRLLGTNNTSKQSEFTSKVGKYDSSIRIPKLTNTNGRGEIEDRRPGANMNPYTLIPYLVNASFQ